MKVLLSLPMVILPLFLGCAGTATLITPQMVSDAESLRKAVIGSDSQLVEARVGDSLYVLAGKLREQGKEKEAFAKMDLAIIFFRLASAREELAQSRKKALELETSLKVARSKLEEYERVLSDLKSPKDDK